MDLRSNVGAALDLRLEAAVGPESAKFLKSKASCMLAEVAMTWAINAAADLALQRAPTSPKDIYSRLEVWKRVSDHFRLVEMHLHTIVLNIIDKDIKGAARLLDLFQRLTVVVTTARNAMPTWAVDLRVGMA